MVADVRRLASLRARIQDQKDGHTDAGTVCSPLVPRTLCGADVAAVLGLRTLPYLPFCCFNTASPLLTLAVAFQPVQHR